MAKKKTRAEELLAVIKAVEWKGWQQGQGSGYMSSGDDGPMIRACPMCNGIDPSDQLKNHFTDETHGHQRGCKIAAAIAKGARP